MGTRFSKKDRTELQDRDKNKDKVKAKANLKFPSSSAEDFTVLASRTPFSVSEVESLYELFVKLGSSVVKDGLIQKEDLQLALFRSSDKRNLFLDRFGEFVESLSIFHPRTPEEVKIKYAFKLYDLRHTGYIESEELKEMVLALLNESDLILSDYVVEMIVEKTFKEADTKGDGMIDEEEWKEYVAKNPSLLKNMTLTYLMDISLSFPSFVGKSEAKESQS